MTTTRSRPAQGTFCWMEHASRDRDAAKAFYGSVFGWTFEDHPMPGDTGGTYTRIRQAGEDVGGMYAMEGPMFEGVPAHWMSYIQVDDVDAAAARAREAGGRLGYEPMDTSPASAVCAWSWIRPAPASASGRAARVGRRPWNPGMCRFPGVSAGTN